MTKSIVAATAIALSLVATPSLALKFDFTQPGSELGAGNTFNKGGVSGTVTATSAAIAGTSSVVNLSTGLGVKTACLLCGDDDLAIDGVIKEKLTFTFDDYVEIVSIDIGAVEGDEEDDWDVLVDGELFVPGGDESTENPFTFGGTPILVKSFSIRADDAFESTGWFSGGPDDVTVAGFTVVPLPGALPLIATGAAFFGWAARRKRAA